ncbi:MAG: translocation/assembly module TamB domain-containing protein, partial [Alloprevotella sp.]
QVAAEPPAPESTFDLTLGIDISDAAQFHCSLSDDGESYVDLEGGGLLTLRMTQQGDMRMTGRFTTHSGEMKYALPVIPLKTFTLAEGSYVEFTGDVMNPTLQITAKERTKAVVTENGKSRSVAFNVGVALTKPLNDMGLEFLIEAPEDLNVQNQLATMTPEQRSKTAVSMMATGMYVTDEGLMSEGGFKANNALNAFLQNEIQHIAGSALKTIDINLGVESGTSATGTSTTDYSFQFAKRFWGNRVSVIIGGKVSTGADATNSAESFINNVSVEYRLDKSATRYVTVFYDRNINDPLEGQLTKTGAGLMLRRKTDRLGELFLFRNKKKSTQPKAPAQP